MFRWRLRRFLGSSTGSAKHVASSAMDEIYRRPPALPYTNWWYMESCRVVARPCGHIPSGKQRLYIVRV